MKGGGGKQQLVVEHSERWLPTTEPNWETKGYHWMARAGSPVAGHRGMIGQCRSQTTTNTHKDFCLFQLSGLCA